VSWRIGSFASMTSRMQIVHTRGGDPIESTLYVCLLAWILYFSSGRRALDCRRCFPAILVKNGVNYK
jgi:hypothetical protein